MVPAALATVDVRTHVGKVEMDVGSIRLPSDDSGFTQFLPNRFVQKHRGFRSHRIGENRLVAVIDHQCTLNRGIDSRTKSRKQNLSLSEALMTADDDELQNPQFKIRRSSRVFTVDEDTTIEEVSELAENDPCVVVVGNDAELKPLAVPDDTNYAANLNQRTSYLNSINFPNAYDKFFGVAATPITADVIVAVIDSGVYVTHEDLAANLWVNSGEIAGNLADDDGNGKIDDINGWNFKAGVASPAPQTWTGYGGAEGHGTHVSGIIGAVGNNAKGVIGIIGTHSKIMGLNVFGNQPSASTTNIDNAIAYAVNKGAQVINLSLGGETYAASTRTAIDAAVAAGTVVVAAAGNGDSNGYGLVISSSYGIYPASYAKDISGMISVGSFDALSGARSVFSNCSSSYVEVSAPGAYDSTDSVNGGIPSTWHTSTSTYVKKNGGFSIYGTSMAAPVISGAAALAMSLYKTNHGAFPSAANVESWLLSSGSTVSALSTYVKSGKAVDLNSLYTTVDAQ